MVWVNVSQWFTTVELEEKEEWSGRDQILW